MNRDPYENLVLDDEEKEIIDSIERGEWKRVKNFEARKKELEAAAHRFMERRRAKPVTIRVNQHDLEALKAKARKKNIPYQTLLGALIRDFVNGDYKIVL